MRLTIAAALATFLAASAQADPVRVNDDDVAFELDVPADWARKPPITVAAGPMLLFVAQEARQKLAIVVRARLNTDGAYEGGSAFFDGLEQGVKKEVPAYQKLSATTLRLGKKRKLPTYDLWYRADAQLVRGVRFVFFKGYALELIVETGPRIDDEARRMLESFQPAR